MIYNYESKILKWMHDNVDVGIKLMTYSTDEDLLTAMDTIKEMPAFFYSRSDMEIVWNKTIHIEADYEDPNEWMLYPYLQKYTGTIIVETQKQALQFISKLKYAFNKTPQVVVSCPFITESNNIDTEVRVSLWLTGISVEDVRRPNDKIGSCRAVRFSWQSQLILNNELMKSEEGLVERVDIGYRILPDGETVQAVRVIRADVAVDPGKTEPDGTVEGNHSYLVPLDGSVNITLTAYPKSGYGPKWTNLHTGEETYNSDTLTFTGVTESPSVKLEFIPINES